MLAPLPSLNLTLQFRRAYVLTTHENWVVSAITRMFITFANPGGVRAMIDVGMLFAPRDAARDGREQTTLVGENKLSGCSRDRQDRRSTNSALTAEGSIW